MNNNLDKSQSSEISDESQLMAFIKSYSEHLRQHKSSVDLGKNMLEMGTKTELVQEFEKIVKDPIEAVLNIKKTADDTLLKFVDDMVRFFMIKARDNEIVNSAFKRKGLGNELLYGIVLKEDNFENRDEVFSFLNFYSLMDLAEKIPINFQFIPPSVSNKVAKEEIIF